MIFEKENEIFDEWKEGRESFICDGVADEGAWSKAETKCLFLLREVNDCPNEFDEREYLKHYDDEQRNFMRSATIDVLKLWAYGLQNLDKEQNWGDVERCAADSATLESIALVNLKKSTGGGIVDWDNFDKFFKNATNQNKLRDQLSIYHPDYFICGGTAYYLSCLYPEKFAESKWKSTSRGILYIKDEETIYVDYKHPNIRAPKNIMYYALMDAVKEIKKQ